MSISDIDVPQILPSQPHIDRPHGAVGFEKPHTQQAEVGSQHFLSTYPTMPAIDPTTQSNYREFTVHQGAIHMDIDFDARVVHGKVTFTLEGANATQVVLDTSYITIHEVTVNGTKAEYTLHPRKEPLGSKLEITLPQPIEGKFDVTITYDTTEQTTALQFLDKEVTDGKVAPYLFSQCEAIHARSMVPCFDTPSVKCPYKLSATSPYKVLMSGRPLSQEGNTYYFDQPVPIPLYLITVASGDITGLPIGPRSTVYSEPVKVKDAQWEFEADMENFLQIAEKLVFAYEWGTYDALVLPASFPYGGMENPNMTFLTPTLICKDRLCVGVVAHELAHSWLGNLVTLALWSHFWLNEGWTVYLERRIIEAIAVAEAKQKGLPNPEEYGAQMRLFSAIIGWTSLEGVIANMGADNRYTKLYLDLTPDDDPDDAFSQVPYEKGLSLLVHLEQKLGGKTVFDPFIPHYFKTFRYKLLDTDEFLDCLYKFFADKKDILDLIDWKTWLHTTGLPPKPAFDTTLADQCYQLVDKWSKANGDYTQFTQDDLLLFSSNQVVVWLDTMLQHKWDQATLAAIDKAYPTLGTSSNYEIVFRYYKLQVAGGVPEYCQKMAEWLGTVGRMKFVRPLYQVLAKVDRDLAVKYFKKWQDSYHPICRSLVVKDLGL